jgi:RND family efflux transporter MFP subunit
MKKHFKIILLILIAVVSFLAGSWVTFEGTRSKPVARKILHYVDPMNPALKSDKPGIAPCGMPLEPVYADQTAGTGETDPLKSLPPGTIRISPEKQQLIGVKTMTVEKAPWTHTLRALGRVTPDETLVYRINASTEGWIEKTMPVTTGSQVKKNELLATLSFFSLEYRTLVQNYFNLITLGDVADDELSPLVNNPQYSKPQLRQMRQTARYAGRITQSAQVDYFRKSLNNYGMTAYQIEEIERTRTFPEEIEIRAPVAGFILLRNVSTGLRLSRGEEMFRIADLSRVWILADIFENEAAYFKPGMQVRMELPYRKKTFYGRVSPVLPQFDPATRTLKMRLVADNAGFDLRPDMFVNLEIPMSGPAAIVVPLEAVLDSGLKKTVFVVLEGGYFEPRSVETGRHLGDRVEIVQGLMPGEKIVVSGNFLIDSETRMQQAAAGIQGKVGRDLVCGMNIDEDRARAEGNVVEYKGKTYYFCEPGTRDEFKKDPERYLNPAAVQGAMPPAGSQDDDARQPPHDAAAVPKPRAAETAPAANNAMKMPGGEAPGKMPGMPAPPPESQPKRRGVATPSTGAPGMNQPRQSFPGPGPGGMPMPAVQAPDGPGADPMFSPAASLPETGPGTPSFPGAGGASLPQGPDMAPGLPDAASMPGSPDPSPISGPQAGETPTSATGPPEVKR